MADKSKIEWTDATWNPIRGCSRVSEGCRNCYAERIAARFSGPGQPYEGLAKWRSLKADIGLEQHWTGEVRFIPELLEQPLHWRKPRRIFVNSMSDLFHEKVLDEWLDQIFAAMLVCPQHTFQILTKRPAIMTAYMAYVSANRIDPHMAHLRPGYGPLDWPWRNIWLGVSVEDQKTADERIPLLLQTPAAVRWVSYEPALGPVDCFRNSYGMPALDWIVAGGESGPGARPAHPDWFRAARDQCKAAGVPFFFKQWGEFIAHNQEFKCTSLPHHVSARKYRKLTAQFEDVQFMRVGKQRAGRLLDGREWNEFPRRSVRD
jgi:protein gp37